MAAHRFGLGDTAAELAGVVREVLAAEPKQPGSVWPALADVGVFGLLVPESFGGLGLSEMDAVGVLVELGRACASGPVAETMFVAAPLLAEHPAWAHVWLGSLSAGRCAVAVATVPGGLVVDADGADLLLSLGDGAGAVPLDPQLAGLLVDQPAVDPTRRLASLPPGFAPPGFAPPGFAPLADLAGRIPGPAVRAAADRGVLASAAHLLGAAEHLLAATVEYAKLRRQFGRQVGSFQAVKHRLADLAVAVSFARPVVHRAAFSLTSGAATASRDCSAAKVAAVTAAESAAESALRVHGAIGYTEELDLHRWLRRVWWTIPAWGDAGWHRARVADVLASAGADLPRTP